MSQGSQPRKGIFANVRDFVSREYEYFIANATGNSTAEIYERSPEPSSSRVEALEYNKEQERVVITNGRDEPKAAADQNQPRDLSPRRNDPPQRRSRPRSPSRSPTRSRSRSPVARSQNDRPQNVAASRNSRSPPPRSRRDRDREDPREASSSPVSSPSPTLPSFHCRSRKSFTMPGSLFPRSESLQPETPPFPHTNRDERHQSSAQGLPARTPSPVSETDEAFQSLPGSSSQPSTPSLTQTTPRKEVRRASSSPLRPNAVKSVQDAVRRFQENPNEDDAWLLLPNTPGSPDKGKGKARAWDDTPVVHKSKSQERELADNSRNEKRAADISDLSVSDLYPETSGVLRFRGKKQELLDAREEQMRKEEEWGEDEDEDEDEERSRWEDIEEERERDKERIRLLEEEVRKLRNELSKKHPTRKPSPDQRSGPPPPPPPPPPLWNGVHNKRDNTVTVPTTEAFLTSVRASLRPTAPPVEAPINGGPSSKGKGKMAGRPTVNVSSDKMVGLLTEMKTVQLRRVSDESSGSGSQAGGLSRSVSTSRAEDPGPSAPRRHSDTLRRHGLPPFGSFDTEQQRESRSGEKRKRDEIDLDEQRNGLDTTVKRRNLAHASASSASTSQDSIPSTVPDSGASQDYPVAGPSRSQTYPLRSRPVYPEGNWHGTDGTTPSLSSDDVDGGDTSPEDRLATPPEASGSNWLSAAEQRSPILNGLEEADEAEITALDIEELSMHLPPEADVQRSPSPPKRRSTSAALRPPPGTYVRPSTSTSNGLLQSPRRTRPPARTGQVKPAPHFDFSQVEDEDEEDDPLILGPSTRQSQSRPSRLDSQANGKSAARRGTLDEEFRRVNVMLESEHGSDDEDDILIGEGTVSKDEGFLAHGGAGGIPVFMGEGYVQGVSGKRHANGVAGKAKNAQRLAVSSKQRSRS